MAKITSFSMSMFKLMEAENKDLTTFSVFMGAKGDSIEKISSITSVFPLPEWSEFTKNANPTFTLADGKTEVTLPWSWVNRMIKIAKESADLTAEILAKRSGLEYPKTEPKTQPEVKFLLSGWVKVNEANKEIASSMIKAECIKYSTAEELEKNKELYVPAVRDILRDTFATAWKEYKEELKAKKEAEELKAKKEAEELKAKKEAEELTANRPEANQPA